MKRSAWLSGTTTLALAISTFAAPAAAEQEKEVRWSDDWHRVRLIEVADILALTVASIGLNATPVPDHAHWSKPILFDDAARKLFKSNDPHVQELAGTWSDRLYQGMVLAPYIIDNYVVALGVHENADVALQMTLINLQSLGLSGVMSLGAEHAVGRARPYVQDCANPKGGPDKVGFNQCGTEGDFQSFYSGHAAATFTMAGLTCAHHQHLPLWGGGLPDALACFGMVGLAATTGILRMVVDRHWASDVLLGTTVGIVNGYVIPMWLHYGFGPKRPIPTVVQTSFGYIAPIPEVLPGGAGLGVAGVF
jgi:PAP2 superfamily